VRDADVAQPTARGVTEVTALPTSSTMPHTRHDNLNESDYLRHDNVTQKDFRRNILRSNAFAL
jgi:hypothetical protein